MAIRTVGFVALMFQSNDGDLSRGAVGAIGVLLVGYSVVGGVFNLIHGFHSR